jgi:uncharacterized cupin superfamily protein
MLKVKKPSKKEIQEAKNWSIWEKEKSVFPWEYDEKETCYIINGKAKVITENGQEVEFKKGDWVEFPKGLKCKWTILEDIKKYYKFG